MTGEWLVLCNNNIGRRTPTISKCFLGSVSDLGKKRRMCLVGDFIYVFAVLWTDRTSADWNYKIQMLKYFFFFPI